MERPTFRFPTGMMAWLLLESNRGFCAIFRRRITQYPFLMGYFSSKPLSTQLGGPLHHHVPLLPARAFDEAEVIFPRYSCFLAGSWRASYMVIRSLRVLSIRSVGGGFILIKVSYPDTR